MSNENIVQLIQMTKIMKKKAYLAPANEIHTITIQQIMAVSNVGGTAGITEGEEDERPGTADSRGIFSEWNDEGI